ncbi:TRAP transporter small permease [Mariniblastus sp.]|nr:TRAP transporter small permease [Mariniblastus sp.]
MSEANDLREPGTNESTPGPRFGQAFGQALGPINTLLMRTLEILAIIAAAALVLDVVWGVVTRAMPGGQAKWTEELARFLLIWVSMLGGALAFRRREHLGIDFLVTSMHSDVGRSLHVLKHGIVCVAAAAVFLYGGVRIVSDALIAQQTTPALGWKMGYVYAAVPLAGAFILLFSLEEMFSPSPSSASVNANRQTETTDTAIDNPFAANATSGSSASDSPHEEA